MKPVRLNSSIFAKVTDAQRAVIDHLAETQQLSLGEATREILSKGIEAMTNQNPDRHPAAMPPRNNRVH